MNRIGKILFVVTLIAFTFVSKAQTYNMSAGTVNTCSGTFYDQGGSGGSYNASQNITQTFCSNTGQPIYLIFSTFNLENNFDFIYVYDGTTTASPLLGTYTGTTNPGTVTATGTCITIRFTSDGSVQNAGWAATIGCGTPPPPPPPPAGSACSNPNSFCGNPISYPAGTGGTPAPAGPAYGCLGSQPNPAWFNMQVANTGPMNFTLSAGSDIDYIIWGPFASPTSACLAGLTAGTIVSCSYSGSATEYPSIPNAQAGEYYILLITNFSGASQTINFNQSGGTGTANCNILCNITNMTGTAGACNSATNTFDVTGTLTTTAPPSSGTLTISSSCGGNTLVLNPPFSTSYNYSLTGIPSGTGTCTLTAAYSADVTCTRTVTVTAPASCTSCNVTAANGGPYCTGATINLTANGSITSGGALTYSWTGPNGFTSNQQNPSIPGVTLANDGIYTVTATSGTTTCTASTPVTVSPVVTLSVNSGTICNGSSMVLTATGGSGYTWSPAAGLSATTGNSVTANPTTTTVYTVSNTACPGTATSTVTVNPIPVVTVNSPTICIGASDILTANGATTYAWSPATNLSATTGTSVTASPTVTTVYTVAGTSLGCTGTATATVTVDPLPVITVNSATVCPGFSDTLFATGATTYSWAPATDLNSTTGSSVISTPASTITYTVTGTTNGCVSTQTTTVTVDSNPVIMVNSDSICNGNSTVLTALGATGYSWSPAAGLSSTTNGSVTANPTTTTVYTVTGTTNGCIGTGTSTVTVLANPIISVNSPVICLGDNATINASGATTYIWSPGTGLNTTSGATVVANPTVTTVYNITGFTLGCFGTTTSTVTVNSLPNVVAPSIAICINDTASITASGALSYLWTPSTGLDNPISATVNANPTSTITYQITGTDVNGCVNTTNATVTVNPLPLVNAGVNDTVCLGSSTTLTAIGALSYVWNADPTLSNTTISGPTATPTITNTYTVTGTDINGCVNTDDVTLVVPPSFSLTASSTPALCFGSSDGTASVVASPGVSPFAIYTFVWNTGATTASISGLAAATYSVVVRDFANCLQTASVTISQPTQLVLSQTSNTQVSCNSGNDGAAVVSVSGGSPAYTYNWMPSGGTSANLTGAAAGSYTVMATDANGCNISLPVTITEPQPFIINPPADQTICLSTSATMLAGASGGNPGYTYSWADNSGVLTGNSVTVSPSVTNSYTISAVDVLGCTSVNQPVVTVTVNPALAINSISNAVICESKNVIKDVSGTGGNGNHYYTWAPSTGVTLLNATGSSAKLDPVTSITYTVTLHDNCGTPSDDTSFVLTVNPTPTVTITPPVTSGCQPLSVNFVGSSNPGPSTCFWNFGGIGTSSNCSPTQVFSQAGSYSISYHVTDINGCENTTTSSVVVYPVPHAEFVASPQPTTIIDPEVTFTDITFGNIVEHTWFFNDSLNSNSTLATPSYIYLEAGEYPVTLAVKTDKGCVDTATQIVYVDDYFVLYVPNSFTPDGDHMNDEFKAVGTGLIALETTIFDRWGGVIFNSADIDLGWNGKDSKDIKVEKGVYIYNIVATNFLGEKKQFTGHVTVVR